MNKEIALFDFSQDAEVIEFLESELNGIAVVSIDKDAVVLTFKADAETKVRNWMNKSYGKRMTTEAFKTLTAK